MDILTMSKLLSWMMRKDEHEKRQKGSPTSDEKLDHIRQNYFRTLMSKDPNYIMSKQRMMQPVFDFSKRKQVNLKAKNNFLVKIIQRDSMYAHHQGWKEAAKVG